MSCEYPSKLKWKTCTSSLRWIRPQWNSLSASMSLAAAVSVLFSAVRQAVRCVLQIAVWRSQFVRSKRGRLQGSYPCVRLSILPYPPIRRTVFVPNWPWYRGTFWAWAGKNCCFKGPDTRKSRLLNVSFCSSPWHFKLLLNGESVVSLLHGCDLHMGEWIRQPFVHPFWLLRLGRDSERDLVCLELEIYEFLGLVQPPIDIWRAFLGCCKSCRIREWMSGVLRANSRQTSRLYS